MGDQGPVDSTDQVKKKQRKFLPGSLLYCDPSSEYIPHEDHSCLLEPISTDEVLESPKSFVKQKNKHVLIREYSLEQDTEPVCVLEVSTKNSSPCSSVPDVIGNVTKGLQNAGNSNCMKQRPDIVHSASSPDLSKSSPTVLISELVCSNHGLSSQLSSCKVTSTVNGTNNDKDEKDQEKNCFPFIVRNVRASKETVTNCHGDIFEEPPRNDAQALYQTNTLKDGAVSHVNSSQRTRSHCSSTASVSEEGKVLRERFASSGYGTGSKESTQELFTSDTFDENVEVFPVCFQQQSHSQYEVKDKEKGEPRVNHENNKSSRALLCEGGLGSSLSAAVLGLEQFSVNKAVNKELENFVRSESNDQSVFDAADQISSDVTTDAAVFEVLPLNNCEAPVAGTGEEPKHLWKNLDSAGSGSSLASRTDLWVQSIGKTQKERTTFHDATIDHIAMEDPHADVHSDLHEILPLKSGVDTSFSAVAREESKPQSWTNLESSCSCLIIADRTYLQVERNGEVHNEGAQLNSHLQTLSSSFYYPDSLDMDSWPQQILHLKAFENCDSARAEQTSQQHTCRDYSSSSSEAILSEPLIKQAVTEEPHTSVNQHPHEISSLKPCVGVISSAATKQESKQYLASLVSRNSSSPPVGRSDLCAESNGKIQSGCSAFTDASVGPSLSGEPRTGVNSHSTLSSSFMLSANAESEPRPTFSLLLLANDEQRKRKSLQSKDYNLDSLPKLIQSYAIDGQKLEAEGRLAAISSRQNSDELYESWIANIMRTDPELIIRLLHEMNTAQNMPPPPSPNITRTDPEVMVRPQEMDTIQNLLPIHQGSEDQRVKQQLNIPDFGQLFSVAGRDSTKKSCHQQTASSWLTGLGYQLNTEIMRKLELSARCTDMACAVPDCQEIKGCLQIMERSDVNEIHLNRCQKTVLLHMYQHCLVCKLLRCPFGWCRDALVPTAPTAEEAIHIMKQRLEHFVNETFLLPTSKNDRFLSLSKEFPSMPKGWTVLSYMTNSAKSVFALPAQDDNGRETYWFIKKMPVFESGSQLELLTRLARLKLSSVVTFLWALKQGQSNTLVTCARFEMMNSLEQCLQDCQVNHLKTILKVMLQLTEAARHLNQARITYLYWSSGNVLLQTRWKSVRVKLTNFSAATLLDKSENDVEDICRTLPVHLFPPELLLHNQIHALSDLWGLGCILHEMVTGQPIWHDYRHDTPHQLMQQMKQQVFPHQPEEFPQLRGVFTHCWKLPSERGSLEGLHNLLIKVGQEAKRRVMCSYLEL